MAENFFGITHTGTVRENNEDAYIAEKLSGGLILACVIDGVGGYEAGEVAAEIAQSTLLQTFRTAAGDALPLLKQAVLQANQNIYNAKLQGKGSSEMACVLTVALVDVENNQFWYAHVGDTRLYLLRDGSLVKVTKDQSFVGFLEDTGRLTEAEAMAHPKRNEINKALGFDAQIELKDDYIETGQSPFLPNDVLMLCSDGLTDLVNARDMTSLLVAKTTLDEKGKALVAAANNAGGKDNITVVLVKNDKRQKRQRATKPVLVKKTDNSPVAAVATSPTQTAQPQRDPTRKGTGAVTWALAALCLALAGLSGWLWMRNNRNTEAATLLSTAEPSPNAAEKTFRDSLGTAASVFNVAPSAQTINLSDTVFIRQDTLRINGNGLVLQADSAYSGPALFVTGNCKQLVLENITFRNFRTGIVTQAKGFAFSNVVFENTALPVLQEVTLRLKADTLNGLLTDSTPFKKRSLP